MADTLIALLTPDNWVALLLSTVVWYGIATAYSINVDLKLGRRRAKDNTERMIEQYKERLFRHYMSNASPYTGVAIMNAIMRSKSGRRYERFWEDEF